MSDYMTRVVAALTSAANGRVPNPIEPNHSLVLHLGFDSLKMSLLSLSLEREFGCTIALDRWLGSHPDPDDLTVATLCDFVKKAVGQP